MYISSELLTKLAYTNLNKKCSYKFPKMSIDSTLKQGKPHFYSITLTYNLSVYLNLLTFLKKFNYLHECIPKASITFYNYICSNITADNKKKAFFKEPCVINFFSVHNLITESHINQSSNIY